MAVVLLAAGLLGGCIATPAPRYDCKERVERGEDLFEAEAHGSRWWAFLRSGPADSIGAQIGYNDTRDLPDTTEAYLTRYFSFSPSLSVGKAATWLELRVGDRVLPPIRLTMASDWRGLALVPAPTLEPLLEGDGELIITFFDDQGRLKDRVTISTLRLRDVVQAVAEMHVRALERAQNPKERCRLEPEEIIVT